MGPPSDRRLKPLVGNIDHNPKTVGKFHPENLFPIVTMKIDRFCRQICLFRHFYRNQGSIFNFSDETAAITAPMIGLCFPLSGLPTDPGESAHMTMTAIKNSLVFAMKPRRFVKSGNNPIFVVTALN